MGIQILAFSTLAFALLQPTQQIFNIILKSDSVDLVYPPQAHSERGLAVCEPNAVCNILYRRFWFRMRIERMCRCPQRLECSMDWSFKRDNHTMTLNNRSQLKFCQDVAELPQCSTKSQALTVTTQTVTTLSKLNDVPPTVTQQTIAVAACNCQPNYYWKKHNQFDNDYGNGTVHTNTVYRCMKLRKCNVKEFCGNMRTDYYFTYYQCSCPMGHMCLQKDNKHYNVSELLYSGPAYKAVCTPN
ncbi:uncharacterized protein [Periplaneta americana]|uniref:uncharacterized protein n=1 Tax=Periplaneta americana TaxID=6978 RepID=UPI0037E8DE48